MKRALPSLVLFTAAAGMIWQTSAILGWLAFYTGRHGGCPVRMIARFGLFAVTVESIVIPVAICLVKKRSPRAFLCLASVIVAISLAIWRTASTTRSGTVTQSFCAGLAETIKSDLDLDQLRNCLDGISKQALESQYLSFSGEPPSPLNVLRFGTKPVIVTGRRNGESRDDVYVSWNCLGGGYGILFAEKPLPRRGWMDSEVLVAPNIWAVSRGE
jgi:hypothetical protein